MVLDPIAPNIRIGLSGKSQACFVNFSSMMASHYKPEEARIPHTLPLPVSPAPVLEFGVRILQLLYTVICGEMLLILILLFKTPLRKLVILALDKMQRRRGPVTVKTVAETVFIILLTNVYNLVDIKNQTSDARS
ncbi:hypothetical protein ACFX15_020535 [Malus domestica]